MTVVLTTFSFLEEHLQKRLQSLDSARFNNGTWTAVGTLNDGFNISCQYIEYDNAETFGSRQKWQVMCSHGVDHDNSEIWTCEDGVDWEQ